MKPKVDKNAFATEAALCTAFISALPDGWTAYPECCGWDILLVRAADGFQIGIQAKLRLNAHVITQTLEEYGAWSATRPAPDCRAVLVPFGTTGWYGRICHHLGITIIAVSAASGRWRDRFSPNLPDPNQSWTQDNWQEWAPTERCKLPAYVPDVVAGAASPIRLTEWKIKALRIAVLLDRRGYVERADFKTHNIDHRRWLAPGNDWLVRDGKRFVRGPQFPNFKEQHPRVYEEIAAELKEEDLKPEQEGKLL